MDKIFYDTAIFFGGHALIIGHKPEKLTMAEINEKIEAGPQDIEQFGLFDRATPNYTTYYPEVTAEDLKPSDDEFIEPVFRMLSNITVNAQHNPIYFPADVLKKNMYKMIGQTVNIDHEMAVGNAIGTVKAVEWQNAYTANGVKIPAGFNAILKIDGKSNPRIARGIMMDPPSIHANSVTVNFAWKPSHPKMEESEFRNKLGSYGEDGKLIQRIVTDIVAYHETSLVSHGADPFAQLIKDGKIVNPTYAAGRYPLAAQAISVDGTHNFFAWDWKQFSEDYSGMGSYTSAGTTIPDNIINNQNSENMKDLLTFLETFLLLEAGALTEENYEATLGTINFKALKAKAEATPGPVKVLEFEGVEVIEAEITRLAGLVAAIPADLTEQLALAKTGEAAVLALRTETKRLYGLNVEEGKEDATILAMIEGADYKTLQSLHKQYDKLTEGKFGFVCLDCESHNVTRATADPAAGTGDGPVNKSNQEVINKFTGASNIKRPSWMTPLEVK